MSYTPHAYGMCDCVTMGVGIGNQLQCISCACNEDHPTPIKDATFLSMT